MRSTSSREVVGSSPVLATGGRVATVGQLLFAPLARAYSTLHPFGVGTSYGWEGLRQVCPTLFAVRNVPDCLWGGSVYTWGAITNVLLCLCIGPYIFVHKCCEFDERAISKWTSYGCFVGWWLIVQWATQPGSMSHWTQNRSFQQLKVKDKKLPTVNLSCCWVGAVAGYYYSHMMWLIRFSLWYDKVIEKSNTNITSVTSTVWLKRNPPPKVLWQFFQNSWEFFDQILHAYYAFLSTLDYEFLFNYLQLWRSYAILSTTTIIMLKMSTIGWNARWVVALNMA